jgi:hypothetical protein
MADACTLTEALGGRCCGCCGAAFSPGHQNARMPARLDRFHRATALALSLLRAVEEPGQMTPGELAAGLARILRACLGPCERLTVASAAMLALDRDTAEQLAEATLHDLRAGSPVPPFATLHEAARDWATFASPEELKAYLGAIWGRLPEAERQGFLSAARVARRAA